MVQYFMNHQKEVVKKDEFQMIIILIMTKDKNKLINYLSCSNLIILDEKKTWLN